MSPKKGKSVLGDGDEFSWVGSSQTAEQPSKEARVDKSTSRQVDGVTRKKESTAKNRRTARTVSQQKTRRGRASTPSQDRPEEPLQKLGLYLKSSTALELKMQALREGRSASAIVQQLVDSYCVRKKP